MYYFYVLYSLKDQRLYKGITSRPAERFLRHNLGGNKSTAHRKPFVLIFIETFTTKAEAIKAEKFYKSLEGGTHLRNLLVQRGVLDPDGKLC